MDSIISRFLLAALLPTLAVAAPAPAQGDALPLMSRSDTLDLIGLEQSFRHVAQGVAPSVAAVVACAEPAPADADPPRSATLTADRLADLLGDGPRVVGTAFCVDADGYLVTNEHVVRDARQIYATLDDGRTYPALVVGTDPRSDLAVLKIPARLRPVSFAPPGSLQRGQWTITVGNPVGLAGGGELCMSVGVVGAVGRDLPRLSEREGRLYTNLIQTTAEVNPGNSGGPLFDLGGRVVGIVTAVVLPQGPAHGVGFAMPVDEAMLARIEQLKAGRAVTHGFLGVSVRDAEGGGVRVAGVGANTPAAGVLREGDVLLRIDGREIESTAAFIRLAGDAAAGRAAPILLRRDGRERAVEVTPAARVAEVAGVDANRQRLHWRGATLATLATTAGGVRVCALDPSSPLIDEGLAVGSVIADVGGWPVGDLSTLLTRLNETPIELCRLGVLPGGADAPAMASLAAGE